MAKVHIKLERVQTWLFAVPRLRAMVGANTLLGETLRKQLPELAREESSWKLAPGGGKYPQASAEDPLWEHDNPASDAEAGILSRDGGHFVANFERGEVQFIAEAAALLRKKLPGIRFQIRIYEDGKEPRPVPVDVATLSTELKPGSERPSVSLDVARRDNAAKPATTGRAEDLASRLGLRPSAVSAAFTTRSGRSSIGPCTRRAGSMIPKTRRQIRPPRIGRNPAERGGCLRPKGAAGWVMVKHDWHQ